MTDDSNIVNIHDPFFLWGLLEHSDEKLINANETLEDDDRNRLYWTCYFRKRTVVCDFLRENYSSIDRADQAMRKLSEMTKKPGKNEPDLSQMPVPFPLPTSPDFLVNELHDGSFLPTKDKPLKFTLIDSKGTKKTCIYKHGDELLQDALCVAAMKEMNNIFHEEKLDAEVVVYEVLPIDKTEGLIECVDNSHAFIEFKKSPTDLRDFIQQSSQRQTNLFRTFLGFIISGIVLQLADRHDDNIMITDEGKILHIDFGCAFGQKTKLEKLLGLFMDIPNSPFTEDVFIAMIGKKEDKDNTEKLWESIKERLWLCFNALRLHKNRFKSLDENKYKHFYERLMVNLTDDEARKSFDVELEKCYNNRFNSARAFYYQIQQNIVS